ncbi:MAG TPA: ferredoxin [Candidatus Wallbacteria bacterium]|nr:ferredoxin [Candidatus Wallbacteria bacterium]
MIVISNDCTGCGICADSAPAIFKVGDDGTAKVINQNGDKAKVQEAIDSCPVSAISMK